MGTSRYVSVVTKKYRAGALVVSAVYGAKLRAVNYALDCFGSSGVEPEAGALNYYEMNGFVQIYSADDTSDIEWMGDPA